MNIIMNKSLFHSLTGKTVHDASFRFSAKNGDVKYLVVDSNVNFNEDGEDLFFLYVFTYSSHNDSFLSPTGSFRHTRCFIRNDYERRMKEEILMAENRIVKKEANAKGVFIRYAAMFFPCLWYYFTFLTL